MGFDMKRGARVSNAISVRRLAANKFGKGGVWGLLAILFGLMASLLAVLAVALYEGYITPALVNNFTADELGVFAALAVVVAIFAYYRGEQE